MLKEQWVRDEGRGDLGVRFDRLNELRDGRVPEIATPRAYRKGEGFWARGAVHISQGKLSNHFVWNCQMKNATGAGEETLRSIIIGS